MNQILYNKYNNDFEKQDYFYFKNNQFLKRKKIIYLSVFVFFIISIFIIFCYIIYNKYNLYLDNKNSDNLLSSYNVSSLYSSSNYYTSIQLSNNLSIIGLIEIPKINISYPILAESNEESLKISVCRFSRTFTKSCWKFMYCWS